MVVSKPLVPARNIVVRLYWPCGVVSRTANLNQRAKHIKERDELQDHGQREQFLKSFLHAGAEKIHDDEDRRDHGLHNEGGVRRGIARVNLPEP